MLPVPPAISGVSALLPRSEPPLRITASHTSLAAMAKNSAISMSLIRKCRVSTRVVTPSWVSSTPKGPPVQSGVSTKWW